jgi:hypothetical protein
MRVVIVTFALIGMFLTMGVTPAAAATPDTNQLATFSSENSALIGFGALALGAIAILGGSGLGQKNRTYMLVGAVVLAGLFILGSQPTNGGNGAGGVEAPSNVAWSVQLATTYDTDVDVDTEVLDSQGFTTCDGGTPDLNADLGAIATAVIVDESAGTYSYQSDSDDDVARTGAGFQEVDCIVLSWTISLSGTIDANGDGTDDSVTHKARLVSLGPPTFSDGNQTTMSVIYYDSDMGWECGFLTEGNVWVSAFDSSARYTLPYPPTSGGGWIAIGSHNGAGAAVDQGNFGCVLDTTVGSPTGYTIPAAAGNIEWSFTLQVGSETNYRTLTGNWVLYSRA